METEISQFLLIAIFCVVATAIADWENGEEIAMMTIDAQSKIFLVRVLYMQTSRPKKK